jgi:hypothetical protein
MWGLLKNNNQKLLLGDRETIFSKRIPLAAEGKGNKNDFQFK